MFANVLFIPIVFFLIEFWLTSAASRQNSSEQYGRSTYCAARQAPPRSGGCSEAVYNGVVEITCLHFYPFLPREKYAYTTIHRDFF